jgi:hypothetical protein
MALARRAIILEEVQDFFYCRLNLSPHPPPRLGWKALPATQRGESLKVIGNEKVGGSGMCHFVPIWLGPRRSRFVSLSILPSSLI